MRALTKYLATSVVIGGVFVGGLRLGSGDSNAARAGGPDRHPHIHHAIEELREARRELKEARHDFGGHRKDALEAVDNAIRQLERALKFDHA